MGKPRARAVGVGALAITGIAGLVMWQIYGPIGDGWTRADERAQMARCTDDAGLDLTEETCACFQNYFQDHGVTYEQLRSVGAPAEGLQAARKCGTEREHDPFADPQQPALLRMNHRDD